MTKDRGHEPDKPGPDGSGESDHQVAVPRRRPATVAETKALANPLRLRILRLCAQRELTNKQLADRLERDPATTHYHVRQLVEVGFLEAAPARAGESGALEKPYRSTRITWWLDNPLAGVVDKPSHTLFETFREELADAGPDAVRWANRFLLHLSDTDAAELERRILEVLDEYMATDAERGDHPAHGGIIMLHRSPD